VAEPRRGLPRATPATPPAQPAPAAPHEPEPTAPEAPTRGATESSAPEVATPAPAAEPAPAPAPAAAPAPSHGSTRRRRIALVVVAAVVVAAAIVLVDRWFLFSTDAGRAFLHRFPGTTPLPGWVPEGLPGWLGWQHFINAFFLVLLVKTGWLIHTTKRPAAMWAPKRAASGRRISIELWTHLSLDALWLANGLIFVVLLFATAQWVRIVPYSWDVFPNAVSAGLQYVSLRWPTEDGWVAYNSLQVLTYFVTVFIAAPLAAATGIRLSPLWPKKATRLQAAFPIERARALHFPVMVYFVAFVIVHVVLVLSTGALRNLNHMFAANDGVDWWGFTVFLIAVAAIASGWMLVRPSVMKQAGALFGKIGR
jgi:thiosulfate reductase cytochrome b subunit